MCLHIDSDNQDNERILDFFAIGKAEVPEVRAVMLGADISKFKPDTKNLSAPALKEFVGKFVEGKLKACTLKILFTVLALPLLVN